MRYDFRKALSKPSAEEQADKILRKMIETISNQEKTIIPGKVILEFCLKKDSWLVYEAYRVICSTLASEKLNCENNEEALQIFFAMKNLLEKDGHNVRVLSNDLFEVEF